MKYIRFLRGLSGSGKSHIAAAMAAQDRAFVISDDDFGGPDIYFLDNKESEEVRFKAQMAFADLVRMGLSPIVVDNCNLKPYYLIPYVRLAHQYGYEWSITDTDTPWRLDIPELVKRNKGKVPALMLNELRQDYLDLPTEALNVMLRLEPPTDPELALRDAAIQIEKKFYGRVDNELFDYEDWRKNGGFRPGGGDETAASLSEKLKPWRDVNYCSNMV